MMTKMKIQEESLGITRPSLGGEEKGVRDEMDLKKVAMPCPTRI